ncbi:MAG: sigma-70 family RNA polymerase sigma factor [Cetobacterium sp.]|uniref:sigma-70 family RNA polymerase sigma factor n=1 Tax=unclassified Cetobacterium TaxID=2630983 RepID=UPI00163BA2E0|nr:sigma-70 family RNA polymerase sigma factor [Cetobacterium sp. 2A]MBC2856280.1 sigma-70 family RNA polymerase sigma factor [Cetobacterium sp. 2A]
MAVEAVTQEIILRAQQGDQESINMILKNYENFIFLNARNYFLVGADKDDLLQEGMIGLIKAIRAFDESKEASFKTFATLCIKRQIVTAIKAANAQKNMALNSALGSSIETSEGREVAYSKGLESYVSYNPEELYLGKEKMEAFRNFINKDFSCFEKEVFEYMVKGYNYREIAEKLDKTLKTIDNSIQRIKRKTEFWMNKK